MDLQLDPIECPDQDGGGPEVSSKFVVARGNGAPIVNATEVAFDFVPLAKEALGIKGLLSGAAAIGDDGQTDLS